MILLVTTVALAAHYTKWGYVTSTPGPMFSVTLDNGKTGDDRQLVTLLLTPEQYAELQSCHWGCEFTAWDGNDDGDTQDIGEFCTPVMHKH